VPPPPEDTINSIKTNSYEDTPVAPAASTASPAAIAAEPEATAPAAAPAATAVEPAPAVAAPAAVTLLQERLAATAVWLDDAQPQTHTIQLLGANDDQQLNQHLKFLSNIIEMNRLFVYRTVAKGAPSLTVVWGSFDTQRAALQAMAQLPPFLKAYRPLLRTVQGIKAEVRDQKTK
jgi:septal ring-binding cell division protein DamX